MKWRQLNRGTTIYTVRKERLINAPIWTRLKMPRVKAPKISAPDPVQYFPQESQVELWYDGSVKEYRVVILEWLRENAERRGELSTP